MSCKLTTENAIAYFNAAFSFRFVGYKLRNLLAAIDYNKHRVRKPATNAVGEQRYNIVKC